MLIILALVHLDSIYLTFKMVSTPTHNYVIGGSFI